jgi:predicted metal-dependent RNase
MHKTESDRLRMIDSGVNMATYIFNLPPFNLCDILYYSLKKARVIDHQQLDHLSAHEYLFTYLETNKIRKN